MVTDRVKIQDDKLKTELEKVDWGRFMLYGRVIIQVRNGQAVLVTTEQTHKLD